MRTGIKTLVALFFIIASFLLGKYSDSKEANNVMINLTNSLQATVDSLVFENLQLKDSIFQLNNYIDSISKQ